MPYSLAHLSSTSSRGMPIVVENRATETTARGRHTHRVAGTRARPNLSWIAAMTTSTIEIREVKPASTSEPKNSTPIRAPAGASLMMVGKAMKASPTPSVTTSSIATPCACAMKPSAENTPMPHRISKPEFAKPTTRPEPVRSVFFFR